MKCYDHCSKLAGYWENLSTRLDIYATFDNEDYIAAKKFFRCRTSLPGLKQLVKTLEIGFHYKPVSIPEFSIYLSRQKPEMGLKIDFNRLR